jgi:hypothetical protein
MVLKYGSTVATLTAAIAVGAVMGLGTWYWMVGPSVSIAVPRADANPVHFSAPALTDHPALHYAEAVQAGDCATVVRLTWWMVEYLENARARDDALDAVDRARQRLCDAIEAPGEGPQRLVAEGIEDVHLFVPGAEIEPLALEPGSNDLAKPAIECLRLRLSYPQGVAAPRDDEGRRIDSIVVGIHLSEDGYVLKAGIIGNVELDWSSIAYASG